MNIKSITEIEDAIEANNHAKVWDFALTRLIDLSTNNKEILLSKPHNSWQKLIFTDAGLIPSTARKGMSLIKAKYSIYFKKVGPFDYKFDMPKIETDFPTIFGREEEESTLVEALIKAVNKEIEMSRLQSGKKRYKISDLTLIDKVNVIYCAMLDLDDDDSPSFYEGINITLILFKRRFICKGLEFDHAAAKLYFSTSQALPESNDYKIIVDSTFILESVKKRLCELKSEEFNNQPLGKILTHRTDSPKKVEVTETFNPTGLDTFQENAYNKALYHDVTFIWGPPGTGKSYTMAKLIKALYDTGESTLISCLSNVAVDQLLNKVIDEFEYSDVVPPHGRMIRFGRTTDDRLLSKPYLFPEDEETKRLSKELEKVSKDLSRFEKYYYRDQLKKEELALKKRKLELTEALAKKTEMLWERCQLIFCTIAGFMLSERLSNKEYDNLIIDEASMLSMPYLLPLASRVFKRIIFVGDPKQLGPIALSTDEWLNRNIFEYANIIHGDHPELAQLTIQRRSHSKIVSLVNKHIYNGELKSSVNDVANWVRTGPYPGYVIKVVKDFPDNKVSPIGKTRRNFGSRNIVMEILREFAEMKDLDISIGVITPYRGQIKLYYGAISEEKANNRDFWKKVKVGTIHTFQGSECDLIIFDLVEKAPFQVGKLFDYENGEQLVNVALSRAREKLIVVGDIMRFKEKSGMTTISDKVRKALYTIKDV